VEKIKTMCPAIVGQNAVVIGNGWMGRLVSQLLISENVNVTVTLREFKKGVIQVPDRADTVPYSERYKAIEKADIVISATTSPHFTLYHKDLIALAHLPGIIIDLAVPRDVEPSVREIPNVTLLTIDDISEESRALPPESILQIDTIISEHIDKFYHWLEYKKGLIVA
jgi:glutamyl-tRNA reductase